ncbi:MAG: hypothetical protein WCX97_01825 [Candidatus Magasanikbacteria bacterium]
MSEKWEHRRDIKAYSREHNKGEGREVLGESILDVLESEMIGQEKGNDSKGQPIGSLDGKSKKD